MARAWQTVLREFPDAWSRRPVGHQWHGLSGHCGECAGGSRRCGPARRPDPGHRYGGREHCRSFSCPAACDGRPRACQGSRDGARVRRRCCPVRSAVRLQLRSRGLPPEWPPRRHFRGTGCSPYRGLQDRRRGGSASSGAPGSGRRSRGPGRQRSQPRRCRSGCAHHGRARTRTAACSAAWGTVAAARVHFHFRVPPPPHGRHRRPGGREGGPGTPSREPRRRSRRLVEAVRARRLIVPSHDVWPIACGQCHQRYTAGPR